MKRFTDTLLTVFLAAAIAGTPTFAKDRTKTKIKADGDDYKEKTTTKTQDGKETTKVKADDDDYKSKTKTKTKTVKSKTKVDKDDDKVKIKHEEKEK
jgi:hypothetical protein